MSQPGVSKHLKVLENCGLITRSRRGQFRPCHLDAEALDATIDWMAEQRQIWNSRFDQLDAHLAALQADGQEDEGDR